MVREDKTALKFDICKCIMYLYIYIEREREVRDIALFCRKYVFHAVVLSIYLEDILYTSNEID